jgi:myosin-1
MFQVHKKKRPTTAGFKIKTSATALMEALSKCNPHYVRCIKPNDNKRARDWDDHRVSHQVKYLGLLENVRVRRAGFAYRAPFERFLRRYKKLSRNTWGIWGEWTGNPMQGCETICRDVNLERGQWQMGKTKIFIRYPETLFHLEELLERKDFECANKIKKAWKKYRAIKRALEQRAAIANIFKGKKERQRNSINRDFVGDYIKYEENVKLQEVINSNGGSQEEVVFADNMIKVNRRGTLQKRFFIITNNAFYVISQSVKKKEIILKLTRRTSIADIGSVTLSTLADNYLVIHVPTEYDNLIENDKKTEIVAILMEYYELLTKRKLLVNFSDRIQYSLKNKSKKEVVFIKNESSPQAILKGGKVQVPSGLPKDTDSTPTVLYNRATPTFQGQGNFSRGGAQNISGRGGYSNISSSNNNVEQCKTLYDFQAENADELSFGPGEIITIIDKSLGEWWTGELNGKKGIFPSNYVEIIKNTPKVNSVVQRGLPRGGIPRGNPGGQPRGGPTRGQPRGAPPRGGPSRGGNSGGQPRGAPPRGGPSRGGSPRGLPRGAPPRGGPPRGF